MIADKPTDCKFTTASAGSITPQDMIAVYMKTHQNSAITLTAAGTDSSSVAVIYNIQSTSWRGKQLLRLPAAG